MGHLQHFFWKNDKCPGLGGGYAQLELTEPKVTNMRKGNVVVSDNLDNSITSCSVL